MVSIVFFETETTLFIYIIILTEVTFQNKK